MRFYDFCDMFGISIYLKQNANSDIWKCVLEGIEIDRFNSEERMKISTSDNSIRGVLREICSILEYTEYVYVGTNKIKVPKVIL